MKSNKAIWNGTISFGLVSIPVKLVSAIEIHTYGFTLLCTTCKNPINYQRWCDHCSKEIDWEHVVKGLKQSDGSYFVITKEQLAKLKPETTQSIEITEFVPAETIKPIYINNHYYVTPAKAQEKSFYLFIKALHTSGKVAIGDFVMHEREHVCAISPHGNMLLLSTLHYAYEIKTVKDAAPSKKLPLIATDELRLAKELIQKMSKKTFDISKYKDTFAQRLSKAIKQSKKVKPQKAKAPKASKTRSNSKEKEATLMTALRASLLKNSKKIKPMAYAKGR